jgi:hypothetical protein
MTMKTNHLDFPELTLQITKWMVLDRCAFIREIFEKCRFTNHLSHNKNGQKDSKGKRENDKKNKNHPIRKQGSPYKVHR